MDDTNPGPPLSDRDTDLFGLTDVRKRRVENENFVVCSRTSGWSRWNRPGQPAASSSRRRSPPAAGQRDGRDRAGAAGLSDPGDGMNRAGSALLILITLVLAACSSASEKRGVENDWRAPDATFTRGETTEAEVLARLGPPSQMIDLGRRTVFYYLLEETTTRALSLIFYSKRESGIRYDRAVFFFSPDGVLEEYALSRESIERAEDG